MNDDMGPAAGADKRSQVADGADQNRTKRSAEAPVPATDKIVRGGLQVHRSGKPVLEQATSDLLPWNVYRLKRGVVSANRILLSEAFTDFCALQWDTDASSIADAFQSGTADADDLIELTSSVDFLARLILDETIKCWCRPFGGGLPAKVPAAYWEIDDFLPRFATSAFDPVNWHSTAATPTHWVFVDVADFERFMNEWDGADRGEPGEAEEARVSSTPAASADGSEFIRLREVIRMTSLSRSTIYQKISTGSFPEPTRLGTRLSMWRRSQVDAWLRNPR